MANANVWNAYMARYNAEPKDASQLQAFAKAEKDLPNLNFKEAKTCFDANKGKGGGKGGAGAGAAESKEPESSGGNPLFAQLNKGGDITKGLKKVTRDMTNKDKKVSGKVTTTDKPKAAAPAAKKATGGKAAAKPPAIRKQGFRIWVENYTEGVEEIKDAGLKNEVYICNCKNAGFRIGSKVKTVTVDSCQKVQVEIEEVLTSVDMINTKGSTLYIKKTAPTINIDKCAGPRIVLFQDLLDKQPQIVTSMTSDMNISLPGASADDDFKDVPIPYQFITTVDPKTKEVSTVPMSHMG